MSNANVHTGTILGRKYIYRKRLVKKNGYNYTKQSVFHRFNMGKRTVYIGRSMPEREMNVSITDK